MSEPTCPDCKVKPGQLHTPGCDVERCPACGVQFISCDCVATANGTDDVTDEMIERWDAEWGPRRIPWSGEWPGVAEAREFGWYCRRDPDGPGYVPCSADHPGAREDLTRVAMEGVWDRDARRFVREEGAINR